MVEHDRRSGRWSRRAAVALAVGALVAPAGARAYQKAFAANSLIIPTQAEYQTDCGMVSAYGLIYTILYKNKDRVAAGMKPVTVYWVIEPKKLSHHRCDTGTDTLPDYSGYNDNDGCDFAVQDANGQPVALLDSSNAEVTPFNVFTTTYSTSTGQATRSSSRNQTIDGTKKVVKYSGGLWVIDATDRATVLGWLADATPAVASLFHKFRDDGTCTTLPVDTAASHHTAIHSARIGFTAPVARMMNAKPPLIALLAGEYVGILQTYLQNAGLDDIPNAGGTVTSHGVIYDVLRPLTDFISSATYPNGALNMPDTTNPDTNLYQVMWAPHWEEDSDTLSPPADCTLGDETCGDGQWTYGGASYKLNAFNNMAKFADDGFGVFLECASIASFEGSYKMGEAPCSDTYTCECPQGATTCTPGATANPTCPTGAAPVCGSCYSTCAAGYTLNSMSCDQLRCINDANPCPSGSTWRATDMTCWRCYNANDGWSLVTPLPDTGTPRCKRNNDYRNARWVTPNGSAPTQVPGTCPSGFESVCQEAASAIELPGWDPVRFQVTNRIVKNGLSGGSYGGSYYVPDCTDPSVVGTKYRRTTAITGTCFDYHPTTGGPGNMFSQKGNFNFNGGIGHTSHWKPASPVGSFYRTGTMHFTTTRNASDPTRDGWDFVTARHKDDDPAKGMIVYLGGHTYADDAGGNRIVLNTMLNLGFSDAGVEIARSEPVGYVTFGEDAAGNPVVTAETVFQGTYIQRQPPGPYQDWMNYNPVAPGAWRFPYTEGHMRAYALGSLSTTGQDFATNASWDAATRLPTPGNRKIFTAVGGNANLGWMKIDWSPSETNPATCSDPSGIKDSSNNKVCDLSWKLAKCATAGVTQQQLLAGTSGAAKLGLFVQQVKGWCAAHDASGNVIMEPTAAQCDNPSSKWQENKARLGGVDHSSPAIVGPSPYLVDTQGPSGIAWSQRPVVAYFGARDGMLHAAYVSGDTTWTAGGATIPAGTTAGRELWAFLPPGQLCGLATNSAMVDASVNVMDVFGNFPTDANGDGVFDLTSSTERPSGRREWRTVLLATSGEGGAEIFALDVTNPLKPVLLWHVEGSSNSDDRFDLNKDGDFADATDHMVTTNPLTYALKWFNSDDGTQGSHPWIPTPYNTTSATILDALKSGRYDYHNLGYSGGTAIGTMWTGNAFQFVIFVTTNAADFVTNPNTPFGYRGVEVFAIDVVTGQKLWQWENRYTRKTATDAVIADNGIPGRAALVDTNADGSVDRIYVGDLEGHLWELSAVDGRNINYLPSESYVASTSGYTSFPFWGTPPMTKTGVVPSIQDLFTPAGSSVLAQQPLTSPIGVGRFTEVPTGLEPYLLNRIAIAQGTMGVDWSIADTQPGHLYVAPVFPEAGTRLVGTITPTSKAVDPILSGVLLAAATWDTELEVGERIFGMPKIVGNQIFANTSYGSFTGDITQTLNDQGRTLQITATGKTALDTGQKRFGGALIFGQDVVITSDTGIVKKEGAAGTGGVNNRVFRRFTPVAPKAWELKPTNDPAFIQ